MPGVRHGMGFVHDRPGEQAGGGGEDGGDQDSGVEAGEHSRDAADQGTEGVPGVAPEPVDASACRAARARQLCAFCSVRVACVAAIFFSAAPTS